MTDLTVAVWNMEWMNDLFGPNDKPAAFRPDDESTLHASKSTVAQRRADLSGVLNEIDPDIVVLVEGPNRTSELQLFFDNDVTGDWRTHVQVTRSQSQSVGVAVRVDRDRFEEPLLRTFDTNNLDVFDPFATDVDEDGVSEQYHFARRPLYVELHPKDGRRFRILGLHLKSKGIFNAFEWSKWWQMSDGNRRRILAEATRVRLGFIEPYLQDPETKNIPLIVCGDINDGPGLDASEKRLYGSGIERLMGTVWRPSLTMGNALFDSLDVGAQKDLDFGRLRTASFKDPIFNYTYHQVWIDHILYSRNGNGAWVHDAHVLDTMADGKRIWAKHPHASDHFPVVATVTV